MRAHLPVKGGDGKQKARKEIRQGITANQGGLKRLEREANLLGKRMIENTFDWKDYETMRDRTLAREGIKVGALVEQFRIFYLGKRRIKPETWANNWAYTLGQLPQDEPLEGVSVLAVVLKTDEDSRSRELTCQRLQSFCDWAKFPIDLSGYKGRYSPVERAIPTDGQIIEARLKLPVDTGWQWAYGVLAAYGLRPHELFYCKFNTNPDNPYEIRVSDGKTGARMVLPILPNWAEEWELNQPNVPKCDRATGFKALGQRCAKQFRTHEVGFRPYDLRHAYAIRGSVSKGVPVPAMAKLMGHSPQVHMEIYQKWLGDAATRAAYAERFEK
jgi:integrase